MRFVVCFRGVAGLLALVGFVGWLCLSVLLLLVVMVATAVGPMFGHLEGVGIGMHFLPLPKFNMEPENASFKKGKSST